MAAPNNLGLILADIHALITPLFRRSSRTTRTAAWQVRVALFHGAAPERGTTPSSDYVTPITRIQTRGVAQTDSPDATLQRSPAVLHLAAPRRWAAVQNWRTSLENFTRCKIDKKPFSAMAAGQNRGLRHSDLSAKFTVLSLGSSEKIDNVLIM
ncbi:MAG: hypothetical protein ABIU96_08615 [Rhodanobacter sp.]